jgi:oxygen-independent coproporphyrinogen-3 oxidase
MDISLYIHYPFCLRKCLYCAFNSTADFSISPGDYVAGLLREMELRARNLGSDLSAVTLYFGGGTPSLLDPPLASRIIETAARLFHLTADAEITLECNPGTITRQRLSAFRSTGVNRLSLGIQSLDDDLLRRLGRVHGAAEAREAYAAAREAGFVNVGIDLIHSLPGQTVPMWERDLGIACDLGPEHLSLYGLTVEEGTPFALLEKEGRLQLPEDDESAEMYETSSVLLSARGYEQYEIANFARPGFRSRHNSGYWERRTCLGFGAGAHSLLPDGGHGIRCSNADGPLEYMSSLSKGILPVVETRTLSRDEAMSERLFLGLRVAEGVALDRFREEFGVSFEERFGSACSDLFAAGLLEIRDGFLRLPPRARILSNQVFVRFL